MTARKKRPTKREIEAAANAAELTAIREALRWLDDVPPEPDIPVPAGVWEERHRTIGWTVVGSGEYARADKACSLGGSHSRGSWEYRYPSQHGIALYSSESAAWRAARHEAAWAFARRLREIDKQIAKATP